MATRNLELIQWAVEVGLLPGDESEILAEKIHRSSRYRLIVANWILAEIKQFPGIDTERLAKILELHRHTILMHVQDLEEAKLIRSETLISNGAPKRFFPNDK
ncbi:hypothetical protein [Phormidesmis sp. 146-33]